MLFGVACRLSRAERARQAAELRASGLTRAQTAEELGLSLSYVDNLLYDPDGSRTRDARKRWYERHKREPEIHAKRLASDAAYRHSERGQAARRAFEQTPEAQESKRLRRSTDEYRDQQRAYRAENRQRRREQHQARRLRKRGVRTTPYRRDDIIARDKSICHICGKKVAPADLTLDHLIPIAHGGPDSAENVAVAHGICNSRRGAGRLPAQLRLVG